MKDRILLALAFVMTVGPAFADAIRVPEPATITVFGAAAVGAYVLRTSRRGK